MMVIEGARVLVGVGAHVMHQNREGFIVDLKGNFATVAWHGGGLSDLPLSELTIIAGLRSFGN